MPEDRKSMIYMGLQIVLLLFIFATGPLFVQDLPLLLTQIFALLLIFWAFLSRWLDKKSSHHNHLKGHFYVPNGAYEIIRHPIYAGILLFAIAAVQENLNLWRFLAFIVFVVVTLLKLTYEENVMEHHNKEYSHYKSKTNKLIPYFY